jgi:hypothetical protein
MVKLMEVVFPKTKKDGVAKATINYRNQIIFTIRINTYWLKAFSA